MPQTSAPARWASCDGRRSDAAGRGVDQDALARAQAAGVDETGPRGRVVDGHGGAVGEREPARQRDDVGGRHRDLLGVAAEARGGDDAVAGLEALDPRAHLGDLARHLVADDHRRRGRVRVDALAGHDVGEVDAGGADGDPHVDRRRPPAGVARGPASTSGPPCLVMTTARIARRKLLRDRLHRGRLLERRGAGDLELAPEEAVLVGDPEAQHQRRSRAPGRRRR